MDMSGRKSISIKATHCQNDGGGFFVVFVFPVGEDMCFRGIFW